MIRGAIVAAVVLSACRPPATPPGEQASEVALPAEAPRAPPVATARLPATEGAPPVATASLPATEGAPPVATASLPATEGAPPLPRGTHQLLVPGFDAALAAFPDAPGLAGPLPIVIAAHGAGDSPEWQCRIYRALLGTFGVVVCPSGPRLSRGSEGRFFPEHHTLERIVLASLDALVAAFPGAVDPGRVVYTAYSQGATMGALMLPAHGRPFRRLALVEGGYSEWTLSRARRYAETGGERVLFACGTRTCLKGAERSSAILEKAGVETRVVSDLASGHTYGGGIGERMTDVLPWLLSGLME